MKPRNCQICQSEYVPEGNRSTVCDACKLGVCTVCATAFTRTRPPYTQRCCSNACYLKDRWDGHTEMRACASCGRDIGIRVGSDPAKYCSRACATTEHWKNPSFRAKAVEGIRRDRRENAPVRQAQARAAIARAQACRTIPPTKLTSIERALRDAFDERKMSFEMHKPFGRWYPDFTFEAQRVFVLADGDYWHSRPEVVERDARFNAKAVKEGWKVVRLPEHLIKRDLPLCLAEVQAALIPTEVQAESGS